MEPKIKHRLKINMLWEVTKNINQQRILGKRETSHKIDLTKEVTTKTNRLSKESRNLRIRKTGWQPLMSLTLTCLSLKTLNTALTAQWRSRSISDVPNINSTQATKSFPKTPLSTTEW
jgi:hypothetical protein